MHRMRGIAHRLHATCWPALLALGASLLPAPRPAAAAGLPLPNGPEIGVNVGRTGTQTNPQVAVFADGGFLVAWTVQAGARARSVVHARTFAPSGVPESGEFLLVNQPGAQAIDAVVACGDQLVAVWEARAAGGPTRVFAGRFERQGRPIGAPVQVHSASSYNRYGGRLAIDPSGGFLVSWTADDAFPQAPDYRSDVVLRRFLANGQPRAPQVNCFTAEPLTGESGLAAGAGMAPDGTVTCAIQFLGDSIFLFLYEVAPDGSVNEGPFPGGNDSDNEYDVNLAMASDGTFVTAWSDNSIGNVPGPAAAFGRSYGAAVHPQERPFQVNRGGQAAVLPQLAAMPGGAFVAVWTDTLGRDGNGSGVFGRGFAAGGAAQTKDFQVNQTTAGDQVATSIAANEAGAMVVVWQSSTGPNYIGARRLGAATPP